MSTFLDPRFKQLGFSNSVITENVKKYLTEMIVEKITKETRERQKNNSEKTQKEKETRKAENVDVSSDQGLLGSL